MARLEAPKRPRRTHVVEEAERSGMQAVSGEQHWPFMCVKIKAMAIPELSKFVAEQRMCRNCFSTRHTTDQCPDRKCLGCRAPHNSNLCSTNVGIESAQNSKRLTYAKCRGLDNFVTNYKMCSKANKTRSYLLKRKT